MGCCCKKRPWSLTYDCANCLNGATLLYSVTLRGGTLLGPGPTNLDGEPFDGEGGNFDLSVTVSANGGTGSVCYWYGEKTVKGPEYLQQLDPPTSFVPPRFLKLLACTLSFIDSGDPLTPDVDVSFLWNHAPGENQIPTCNIAIFRSVQARKCLVEVGTDIIIFDRLIVPNYFGAFPSEDKRIVTGGTVIVEPVPWRII